MRVYVGSQQLHHTKCAWLLTLVRGQAMLSWFGSTYVQLMLHAYAASLTVCFLIFEGLLEGPGYLSMLKPGNVCITVLLLLYITFTQVLLG